MRMPSSLLPPFACALALAACTVGSDYAGPPGVGTPGAAPAGFVRADRSIATTAPSVARWWTTMGDATLDTLEDRALAANPDVAVADARLQQARSALRLQRAKGAPSVSANATYLHARLPGINLGQQSSASGSNASGSGGVDLSSVDFYNLGFDATWEIDLFGGQRRSVQAARASLGAAVANVADAQVSLTADVAQAYVNLRDAQQRIVLARRSSAMQRQMLALNEQRLARGTVSSLDVERLRLQVENTDAQLVPISAEVDGYLNAIAVLTGAEPGAVDTLLSAQAPVPLPPAAVAIGDPAQLIQRRPDIRAAERQLAMQTARIGVVEAARFPKLSFMGIIGIGGTSPADLTKLDNFTALAAPMLQWNFLNFGRTAAQVRQAQGVRDEADAHYRAVVLGALRDAEDALSRFRYRRTTVASLARASATADRAAALMQQRYHAGTATLIDTLDAERQRVSAQQSLSSATANLTGDYVSLQKALGLGWSEPRS